MFKETEKKMVGKKQKVLSNIKEGLIEIKEAKRTGKKLKTLASFLNEL